MSYTDVHRLSEPRLSPAELLVGGFPSSSRRKGWLGNVVAPHPAIYQSMKVFICWITVYPGGRPSSPKKALCNRVRANISRQLVTLMK